MIIQPEWEPRNVNKYFYERHGCRKIPGIWLSPVATCKHVRGVACGNEIFGDVELTVASKTLSGLTRWEECYAVENVLSAIQSYGFKAARTAARP